MPKVVGILAKKGSKEILTEARKIHKIIEQHGFRFVPDEDLGRSAKIPGGKPLRRMEIELLVTLGGDGTVLKAAKEMSRPKTPILAVNMGRRGYLTEVEPSEFEAAFEKWEKGDYELEEQWKLSVLHQNRFLGEALNEALLLPTIPAKMLNLNLTLRGKRVFQARADGIIVSTPTGSTAHSFSAGGPVLETSMDSLSLTLIAPLQPVKSIVVPVKAGVQLSVVEPGPSANLVIDGRLEREIRIGQSLSFRKSGNSTFFVRFGDSFLQRSLRRLSSERENG
ncbi:NAD(+)/NADH kinase [Candidatus Bathyarchaeota archaeon]|nr:MAG: NAD(+)/NADH kinase [Candidatus Bathyarchaeota archaeon]